MIEFSKSRIPSKNKIAQMITASSLFPRCELAAIKMIAVDARVLIAVELIAAHDRSGPKSIAASTQRAHVLAALPHVFRKADSGHSLFCMLGLTAMPLEGSSKYKGLLNLP